MRTFTQTFLTLSICANLRGLQSIALALCFGITICLTGNANAETDTYSWTGTILTVRLDDGTGTYAGTQVGDTFSGTFTYDPDAGNATINETSDGNSTIDPGDTIVGYFPGLGGATITDGTTQVNVPLESYTDCVDAQSQVFDPVSCIVVGVINDHTMDPDDERTDSAAYSDLLGKDVPFGTVVDLWTLYAQAETFEVSVEYLSLLTNIHDDLSFRANPPWSPPGSPDDPNNQVAIFSIYEYDLLRDEELFSAYGFITMAHVQKSGVLPDLVSLADVNGNNSTDLGVFRFDPNTNKNRLSVMDGNNGNLIKTVAFGSAEVRGSSTVSDGTGDLIPEFGALLEGSLVARVKDVVNGTQLGKPKFNANYDTVAFLSVGDAGGDVGPDVAVVGRLPATGKVQAWVKDVASGSLVRRMSFDKAFVPFAAVAVDNVGDSAAMEIAVLGIDASGNVQAQVKDAQSGKLINKIQFNKKFTPLFFATVPNASGKLKHLAVLGRNASGVIQAQIKRVSNGTLVNKVTFSKSYDPRAFISFADSNSSGGGEVGVVGVNDSGVVRAQVKEIADGAAVNTFNFSKNYPPLAAIAVNGAAGTAQNEIAVLGQHANGNHRLQIKDLLTGNLVKNIPLPSLDTTPPVITLLGNNPQVITMGTAYTELGATAIDNVDGDISGSIVIDSSLVDTNTVGNYGVTYMVSDSSGNRQDSGRTVTVQGPPPPPPY